MSIAGRNILVIHHHADLYGADKSLVSALLSIKHAGASPIVVMPYPGMLSEHLSQHGIAVHFGDVIRISRSTFKLSNALGLLASCFRSYQFLNRVAAGKHIDLVYCNTVGTVGGGLWGKLKRIPTIWHVREIMNSPRIAAKVFPMMVSLLGGRCVCNSHATRKWVLDAVPAMAATSEVVWNGIQVPEVPAPEAITTFLQQCGCTNSDVIVTLVGRINRWKGQNVFIDAIAELKRRGVRSARFLIVGDVADNQHFFREDMMAQIRQLGVEDLVRWVPFTKDIDVVWASSDIAVVPSVDPEPFGRVAIEAMSHAVPVIGSAHGGLVEIIEDGKTGFLVPPSDPIALADKIEALIGDAALRQALGKNALVRQRELFSQAKCDQKLVACLSAAM